MPETSSEHCVEHAPSNAFSNAREGRLAKHATQRNATNATTPRQPERNRALETRANNPVDNRIKVACINWPHPDAPHAMSYLLRDGEVVGEAYHATWDEAMARADEVASRLRRVVVS